MNRTEIPRILRDLAIMGGLFAVIMFTGVLITNNWWPLLMLLWAALWATYLVLVIRDPRPVRPRRARRTYTRGGVR